MNCATHLRVPGLVSVIVPVFNGEVYLRSSLDSILAQTYAPMEVLVMDDASTDRTAAILTEYGDRIRVFRQPSNRGIYRNANDGIGMVQGEYIAIYHADDIYAPEIVAREVEFLRRYGEAGAVFSSMSYIDPVGNEFGSMRIPEEFVPDVPQDYACVLNALLSNTNHLLMCPTAMVRAAVYDDVGLYNDQEFRNTADLDMWLRIAHKYPIGVLRAPLLKYRRFHDCSSMRYHHLRTEPGRYFRIMDLYLSRLGSDCVRQEALAAHEAHRAQDLIFTAMSNYILGRIPEARKFLQEARLGYLLGSKKIQRVRMATLWLIMQFLVRVRRSETAANAFRGRWHDQARATIRVQRRAVA